MYILKHDETVETCRVELEKPFVKTIPEERYSTGKRKGEIKIPSKIGTANEAKVSHVPASWYTIQFGPDYAFADGYKFTRFSDCCEMISFLNGGTLTENITHILHNIDSVNVNSITGIELRLRDDLSNFVGTARINTYQYFAPNCSYGKHKAISEIVNKTIDEAEEVWVRRF